MSSLISAAELSEVLRSDAPVRVLDVRWKLDQPDGREAFYDAHIPGATYVDLESELSRHGEPSEGRHPLPDRADLQAAARGWGVNDGDAIVVVDGGGMLAAARAWWLLSNAGIADVRVLDGGMRAWLAAGGEVERGISEPEPGNVTLGELPAGITIDEAAAWPESGVLLDVRAPERYRGEVEPMDPIAGHIPGAINLPAARFFREDGTFESPAALRALFDTAAKPSAPTAAYCGSGVTAALAALAADVAGRSIEVFPGSWSAWSNTPGRPVATGTE